MNEWNNQWKPTIHQFEVGIRAMELESWIFFLVRPAIAPPSRLKNIYIKIKIKSEKNTIVFQSEGTFYPGIILTESNNDV